MNFNLSVYILPLFVLIAFLVAFFKKIKVFDGFVSGVNGVIPLLISIFPYLCAVLIASELFEVSGLSSAVTKALSPLFSLLKIPPELTKLILIKPLSGSGSIALLSDILKTYGAESYIGKCACCIFGSSETLFYISALYFSNCKNKCSPFAIIVCLVTSLFSCVFACFICRLF